MRTQKIFFFIRICIDYFILYLTFNCSKSNTHYSQFKFNKDGWEAINKGDSSGRSGDHLTTFYTGPVSLDPF